MYFIFILGLKSFSHHEYFELKYADIYFIELKLLNGQKQFKKAFLKNMKMHVV